MANVPLRLCLGCSKAGEWDRSGRCDDCKRDRTREIESDPRRRAHKARRYDSAHRRLRKAWAPVVATGSVVCARADAGQCLHPAPHHIAPTEPWDLDHLDYDSRPSHADCNRAARSNPGDTP